MDAAANDLTQPLGRTRPAKPSSGRVRRIAMATLLGASLASIAALAGSALFGDPRGGRPIATTDIVARPPPAAIPNVKPPEEPARAAGPPGRKDADTVETESGVTVVRPPGSAIPESVVVRVPDAVPSAPASSADPRLVERTRYGLLPRVAPDGAKAVEVYAKAPRDWPPGVRLTGRIALVVGGLGISRSATEEALLRLPDAVTLALAPYGPDLEILADRARRDGREIILQVPMEPFDYPDSDPGPHTLLAAAKPASNLDHLSWAMGRFTGYVALMNYMGAKVTADERALAPIVREAGARGIGFLDDGSSSRSVTGSVAGDTRVARADLVLDLAPRADLIDRNLEKLEAIAVSGRLAIGTASALPVTTERIARWARGLEAKGIQLVPASAALAARPREAARR